jgi:L-fuconolactonase
MFGSDWPVYLLAATYDQVFNLVQDRLASLPAGAQESILGGNAERFYLQRNRSCPR